MGDIQDAPKDVRGYPMRELNGVKLTSAAYHTILSALRGPDQDSEQALSPDSYSVKQIIKSCTAVYVRRAVYGERFAAFASAPATPQLNAFVKLRAEDLRKAVGTHYLSHAAYALDLLRRLDLNLPEDAASIDQVLVYLEGAL